MDRVVSFLLGFLAAVSLSSLYGAPKLVPREPPKGVSGAASATSHVPTTASASMPVTLDNAPTKVVNGRNVRVLPRDIAQRKLALTAGGIGAAQFIGVTLEVNRVLITGRDTMQLQIDLLNALIRKKVLTTEEGQKILDDSQVAVYEDK